MPQTVPTASVGFSPSSFDYSAFQFDLSLLSDDYGTQSTTTTMAISATPTSLSTNHLQVLGSSNALKPLQIKQEARSPRPVSPLSSANYASPSYPCLSGGGGGGGGGGELSPNYSRDASPAYPASPYYLPQSPQSAQLYPTSPEPSLTTAVALQPANGNCNKPPVKREKSFDLLTILHESRLLAESLGYKEDSTDCTVPCTPPRTEEDIYNSLDADFFPKRESTAVANPLLKEILFKEESSRRLSSSSSSAASTCSSSSLASSPAPAPCVDYEKSSLRDLLFRSTTKDEETSSNSSSSNGSTILKLDKCPGIGTPTAKEGGGGGGGDEKSADHQLLREVLRDTSFQRKYNLKPMDLGNIGATTTYVDEMAVVDDGQGGECVGDLAREQIEPVLSLAIQQLQKDFDNTCVALGIHPEPCRWSAVDVAAWVQWARRQLQLPSVPLESFNVDGATLASFSEEDFCQRAPQCGSMLYAQLEIWKAAVEESPRNSLTSAWTPTAVVQSPSNGCSSPSTASSAPGSVKDSSNMEYSDEEDDEASTAEASSDGATGGKIRSSGSHIHLWQFLKKLLQSPSSHGSCIRWLDRNKGVFKIEDSVRVARLWGKRKNRPAMNYDKLSRSIRQYYKKGIMKKTERSQRLVYQFCHPYCL